MSEASKTGVQALRIELPSESPCDARIFLNGAPWRGVRSLDLRVASGEPVTVTATFYADVVVEGALDGGRAPLCVSEPDARGAVTLVLPMPREAGR